MWLGEALQAGEGGAVSECIHGLDTDWCATCKHGPARAERESVEVTFRARYEGDCNGCDLPIYVGQVVHRLSSGRYVHRGCEP